MFYCFFFLWHRRSFPRGPPPGKNLEGWLGFTEGFTGFTKFWRVLLGFAGFYGFYWILLAFSGFYWVLRCFTVFYWVLLDFTGFYWLFLGFTGFYWVLLGFTGIEWKSRPRLTHSVDRAGGGTRQERSCSEVRTKRRRPTKSETADGAQDQAAGTARERACGRAVHRLPPTIAATDLIIDSSPSLLFFFSLFLLRLFLLLLAFLSAVFKSIVATGFHSLLFDCLILLRFTGWPIDSAPGIYLFFLIPAGFYLVLVRFSSR